MNDIRVGIRLTADGKDLVGEVRLGEQELSKLGTQGQKTGRDMRQMGRDSDFAARGAETMRRSYAGLVTTLLATGAAFLTLSSARNLISTYKVQEQAVAGLDASIQSMGRTTEGLSGQLQALASQIQADGIIGDEAIIKGQSFLTTYGDITDDLLPRTSRIMADIAAKMGGDTVQAANLLGKASMGMVDALTRIGITLSDTAKESKDFETILGEIEQQVGGTNRALAQTDTGKIDQFANSWGDLQEQLGQVLAMGVSPFLQDIADDLALSTDSVESWGQSLADGIDTVTGAADEAALAIGGLLVARTVGPALAVMSVSAATAATSLAGMTAAQIAAAAGGVAARASTVALTTSIYGLRTALAFVGGPAGLAILAGGAIAYLATQTDAYADSAFEARLEQDLFNEKLRGGIEAQREYARTMLQVQIAQLEATRAQKEWDDLANMSGVEDTVMSAQVARLEERVAKLKAELLELYGAFDTPPPAPTNINISGGRMDRPGEDADAHVRAQEANHEQMIRNAESFRARMTTETERLAAELGQARELLDLGLIDTETLFRMEEQYDAHIASLLEKNRGASIQWSEAWASAFDNFAQGVGDAVADAMFSQGSLAERTLALVGAIAKQVISALVEIGIKKLLLDGQEKAQLAGTTAAAATSAGTLAAAWAPAAAGASIATAGGAAAAGAAGLSSTYALATSLSSTAIVGIAHGGLDQAKEGTYLLRNDEMVLSPGNADLMRQVLQREAAGTGGRAGDTYVFAPTIQAHDASGFDRLLQAREGRIVGMMRKAFHRNGQRSPV